MKKLSFGSSLKNFAANLKFKGKANAPTLLIIGGLISAGACVISACISTTKVEPIIDEIKEETKLIKVKYDVQPEPGFSKKDMQKEIAKVYGRAALDFAKLYSIPIALFVLSATSILGGCHILKARNSALAAAYLTLDKSYKEYRKRVAEKLGPEVEKEIKLGIDALKGTENTEIEVSDNVVTVKGYPNPLAFSEYARIFDEGNYWYKKDAGMNMAFLKQKIVYWNDILNTRSYKTKLGDAGVVFLNEIYKDLDLPLSKAGQEVGWIRLKDGSSPCGDGYIDFNIFDIWNNPKAADFVNGYERSIWLDFNVDGPIRNILFDT